MQAHELEPNQWYRAERVIDGNKRIDVVFTNPEGLRYALRFTREYGPNPLMWEYYGPLVLDTVAEAEARLDRIQNVLAEQTPCSPS